jgi:Domain of unknown function (DUF4926)
VIQELDTVVLDADVPAHGLKRGDVGAVVHCHPNGDLEVEFVTYAGETVALVSLKPREVHLAGTRELMHSRHVEPRP